MRRQSIAAAGLALAIVAALLATHGSSAQAQPVASITLPEPGGTEQLYTGCNNIGLTFQDGTSSETVVIAVAPSGAVKAMWRHDAAQNSFEGFSPAAPQASDLLTVDFLDAVWICVAGAPAGAPTAASAEQTMATATPQQPPPVATRTPEQQALTTSEYVQVMVPIIASVNDGVTTLGDLAAHPLLDDPLWHEAVNDQLTVIRSAYTTALGIIPPPELADAHSEIVTGLGLMAEGADLLQAGLQNLDTAAVAAAEDRFHEGAAHLSVALALLP